MASLIQRYRTRLNLPTDQVVTLGEGGTPLVHWERWQDTDIYLKLEGLNPTGSFKDRGMTVAVTMARFDGAQAVICASTGNTAASAAAFAARAGLACIVLVPAGRVTQQKLLQSLVHGAVIVTIDGNFDQALSAVRQAAAEDKTLALVNSVNPWRLVGQATGAYEIVDDLGQAPAAMVLPVGNAGNISAYFQGFQQYGRGVPAMIGVQAAGASPLVTGHDVANPETIATAIRIGQPASKDIAVNAVNLSGGQFIAVSDDQILQAQQELAHGGIFVEPASAAAYAGMKHLHHAHQLPTGAVVGVLTGHGLKDSQTPLTWARASQYEARLDTVTDVLRSVLEEATHHVAH